MHRPLRLLAPLCAASLVTLAACGGSSSSSSGTSSTSTDFATSLSGSLKVSGYNPSDEVGKSRSDLATQKVSPVSVSLDTTSFDAQKFSAQVASGQTPDLILAGRPVIDTLADKKLIVPLDGCYKLYGVDPNQRFYPAAVKDVTYDNHVYGVPQFFQSSLIIGNTPVMKQAGVTMDDLDTSKPDQVVAAAQKMAKSSGGKLSVLGFDGDLPGSTALWMAVFGGQLNDSNGKPTLDNANNVKALTFMKQLVDAQGGYAQVKSLRDTFDAFGDGNQFVKNQVGAQTWAQWYINVLGSTASKISVDATTVKTLDGKALGYASGTAFAIPTAARNKNAACAWAIQATSPEAWDAAAAARQATVTQKKGIFTGLFTGSPEADKAIRSKYVKPTGNAQFDKLIATSYDALANTFSFGGSAVGQEITNQLGTAAEQALNGEKTPDAALKDAQTAALRAWDQSNAAKQK